MAIKNKNKTETHFFFYSILSLKIAFSLPSLSTNTYSLLTLPFLKSKHLKLMNSWRTPMNNNPETHVTPRNCCFPPHLPQARHRKTQDSRIRWRPNIPRSRTKAYLDLINTFLKPKIMQTSTDFHKSETSKTNPKLFCF